MQLYIRGAWRTFSERQDGKDIRKTAFHRSRNEETNNLTCDLIRERKEKIQTPFSQTIHTCNLSVLKAFYSAFADNTSLSSSRNRCDIHFEAKQHIVLIDQRSINNEFEDQRPMKSPYDAGSTHRSRQRKTISLQSTSLEAFLASYRRAHGRALCPVKAFIDGPSIAMVYEDPDGNIVCLHMSIPSFAERLEALSNEVAPEMRGGRTSINPGILYERLGIWNAASTAASTECTVTMAACVKSEPVDI